MQRSRARAAIAAAVALAAALALPPVAHAAGNVVWKPVTDAVFKLDGQPAKNWTIYGTKKRDLVLVELGRRFLMLDVKAKEVYEINPSAIEQKGDERRSPRAGKAFVLLPSGQWDVRDVGAAKQIHLELTDEGHSLDIELPHPVDLRGVY
jgi:hypothetical protein